MSSWTERMHRRAATLGNVVTSCGHPASEPPHPRRLEKVKFGVPLNEVCKNDIPGPLLVLILKLNKEAPLRKDIFRAPGHQGNMKKLVHFLQTGHLVNMDNFSVYTIASVLKKFLRKIPSGIFGKETEQQLFAIIQLDSVEQQRDQIHRLITSMPIYTQRLLVLLFGTFRVVAVNCERAHTGMTSEALGVSVAPSFFHSCVSDGKTAKMEDVFKFKIATRITKFMIDNFGVSNLFGRDNYEYYARITGRILKVEEDWIFSFRYPPDTLVSRQLSLEAEKSWLQYECEKWGLKFNLECMSHQEESQSTPALIHVPETVNLTSSLGMIPENTLLESYTRLSVSLEENGLFQAPSRSSSNGSQHSKRGTAGMTLEELRAVNRYAESTKSLSYLPQVHERQAARMRTRSEWFLTPIVATDSDPTAIHILRGSNRSSSGNIATGLSASAESVKRPSLRRTSSREKQRWHRNSSRRNKENGTKGAGRSATAAAAAAVTEASKSRSLEAIKTVKIVRVMAADQQQPTTEKMLDSSHNEIFEEHAKNTKLLPDFEVGERRLRDFLLVAEFRLVDSRLRTSGVAKPLFHLLDLRPFSLQVADHGTVWGVHAPSLQTQLLTTFLRVRSPLVAPFSSVCGRSSRIFEVQDPPTSHEMIRLESSPILTRVESSRYEAMEMMRNTIEHDTTPYHRIRRDGWSDTTATRTEATRS